MVPTRPVYGPHAGCSSPMSGSVSGCRLIFVVGVAIWIPVLLHGDEPSGFQDLERFLERGFFDSGIPNDSSKRRPAVALAAGTANEVGVQLELCGIQRQGKNAVWEKKKVISRRLIFSHSRASVCSSIQRISLFRGTRIRVPILMLGKPSLRARSYAFARESPSTPPTSGAVKVSGSASWLLNFSAFIQFLHFCKKIKHRAQGRTYRQDFCRVCKMSLCPIGCLGI